MIRHLEIHLALKGGKKKKWRWKLEKQKYRIEFGRYVALHHQPLLSLERDLRGFWFEKNQ